MEASETRKREIAQGLRDEGGSLIGGLHVEDYCQGIADYESGAAAPRITTTSYDLGRTRAQERAEALSDLRAELAERSAKNHAAMRDLLKERPDVLAQYEADIARIEALAVPTRTPPNASQVPGRSPNPTPSHRQGGET